MLKTVNKMLSIITPVYNSAKCIEKICKSLGEQTNTDFEWIIVDDCSEDEEYNQIVNMVNNTNYNYIIIRSETNGGPGSARNIGLKNCSGEYVVFVDSDDTVSADFVETIEKIAMEQVSDIILFDFARINQNKKVCFNKIENVADGEVQKKDALLYERTCICGGAFKRTFLAEHNILFPPFYRYEDWVFNIKAIVNCNKIWYEKKSLYYYQNSKNSIVNSDKYNAGMCALAAYNLIAPQLNYFSKEINEFVYAREVIYVNAISLASSKYKKYKETMKRFNQKFPDWKSNIYLSNLPKHQRYVLFLISHNLYYLCQTGAKIASLC